MKVNVTQTLRAINDRLFTYRARIMSEIREAAQRLDIETIEKLQVELEREYQLAIESAEMLKATLGQEY